MSCYPNGSASCQCDIDTANLSLRIIRKDHLGSYREAINHPDIVRYFTKNVPFPVSERDVFDYYQKLYQELFIDQWFWCIFKKNDMKTVIGSIRISKFGASQRGFWLNPRYWGQGIMTEASNAVTRLAFTELGFDSLTIDNAKGNLASRKIKIRQGAKFLRIEQADFHDESIEHREVWQLKKDDFFKINLEKNLGNHPALLL